MKRIGIDFGTKKIGIAVSDESGQMAFPHEVVPNNKDFMSYIEKLIQSRQVEEIVIGHSLNNDGEPNKVHAKVENFITDITLSLGIPVHLEPEQYSTKEASHIQGKDKMTDASAAALILNSYILKNK